MFRLYNQLEEVKQRKAIEERQHIYAQNREKRKEFEKVMFSDFVIRDALIRHRPIIGRPMADTD